MSQVKPVPEGMHTVTPHLVCADAAKAIAFYQQAFNATEMMRIPGPGGKLMHACVRIGDSLVMLVDENPQWGCLGPIALKGSPITIHLQVEDVDAVFDQAVKAGAKITMPVADMFWGDCNDWGLYQMHGNVWEWCQDRFGNYPAEPVVDPKGLELGGSRVLRVDSWIDLDWHRRSAACFHSVPSPCDYSFSFRLARGH